MAYEGDEKLIVSWDEKSEDRHKIIYNSMALKGDKHLCAHRGENAAQHRGIAASRYRGDHASGHTETKMSILSGGWRPRETRWPF